MTTVLLQLEGPLQAWSAQGRLGVRDTEREPTKSGVLGLVGAALGMDRSDATTLASLCTLVMAVRVDREGTVLRDYHTSGGGKFRGDAYFAYDTSNCVPTDRYYLQDARFVVGLEGESALAKRIAEALESPRYPLFLGRRSCPLAARPLLAVVETDAVTAVREAPRELPSPALRLLIETTAQGGDPRYDVPLSFEDRNRQYGIRYVKTETLEPLAEASS